MSNDINIFESAKPQSGEFFKFKEIGDSVQGTYIDRREGTDSFGNQQTIYMIQDNEGKVWNLGFRQTSMVIHDRMKGITFGQIVGFRFDEERESKRNPGTKVKIIRIYADPRLVNTEWVEQQRKIEESAKFRTPSPVTVPSSPEDELDEDPVNVDDKIVLDELPEGFEVSESAVAATTPIPKKESDAMAAVRTLAKTKGLTNDSMSAEEEDATIQQYTGLTLTDENMTKIIIALTGYTKK